MKKKAYLMTLLIGAGLSLAPSSPSGQSNSANTTSSAPTAQQQQLEQGRQQKSRAATVVQKRFRGKKARVRVTQIRKAMNSFKAYLDVKEKIKKLQREVKESKKGVQHFIDTKASSYLPSFCSSFIGSNQRIKASACKEVEAGSIQEALPLLAQATVIDYLNVIQPGAAEKQLFRQSPDEAHKNNPNIDISKDLILWSFRIKDLIAKAPGVFLNPSPDVKARFTVAFLPLLKAMMSVDTTENTLNRGQQRDDPQFSPQHLQRFLENLNLACGGAAKSRFVTLDPTFVANTPDQATPITALGFNYNPVTYAIDWESDESKGLLREISDLLMQ